MGQVSTATDVVVIEKIDTEGSPPCELWDWAPCGRPAAARLRIVTACCGIKFKFVCAPCLEQAKTRGLACARHYTNVTSWREA